MALSKPLFSHLKSLNHYLLRRRQPSVLSSLRLLSFATPEEAAADRRRRKRRLRIEPPLSSLRHQNPPQQQRAPPGPRTAQNPNAPKLPEPVSALAGSRLKLHNNILTLIRENDLDEAALLVRHSIYSNCRPTVYTANAVLHALLRQCRYADLLSLHRFITQASVAPTVVTHNLLLQTYCDCRKTDTALEHFRLLLKDDAPVLPSPTTYRILAKGLVDNGKFDQAAELKDDMLARGFFAPDPVVYNHVMYGFIKNQEPDRVIALYEELKEKLGGGLIPDGIVYGNLMKGYFMKGMEKEAMEIYGEVLGEASKVRFNAISYNTVLDALGRNGKLEDALNLFDRMMREHNPPLRLAVNLGTFNVMVDAYSLAGRFQDAITVFGQMGDKKCTPDTLSYNNLIDQLGKNKLVAEAEEMYREMESRDIKPDEYTFVLLVESCFGVDRVDDAIGYFVKMVELGLRPNAGAYNKLMEGLVNVGRLDEAKGFFNQMMLEKEVKPNVTSYELLLKGFISAGRLDDGLTTLKDLLLDESVILSEEMKEFVEEALRKEGREDDMGRLYEDVEQEKAERRAREAEEKAKAEALAREEEERKKREAAEKEAASARASAAAIEAVLGRKREADKEESPAAAPILGGLLAEEKIDNGSAGESETVPGDQIPEADVLKEVTNPSSSDEETKQGLGNGHSEDSAS